MPDDLIETRRIAHRKGAEDVGVEHGEDAGRQREPDRQRQDRRGGKGGTAQQRAASVAQVLRELLEPHPS